MISLHRDIENILAKGNADGTEALLEVLKRELDSVLYELSPYLDEPYPQALEVKTLDILRAREVFGKLEALLQIESAKCLGLIKELSTFPDTDTLITQIEDYEFEIALKTLSSFKESLGEFEQAEIGKKEPRRIMVVDDEVNNVDALCQILLPLYDVIVAKNGRSALQKAQKHMPDIILLDVIMPDMTGFEVISHLKSTDLLRKIPVIFITGLNNIDDEEKGLMLGAVDYITKPFHAPIVKARVHAHLQNVEYIETIERLCMVDALTVLPNRRSFDERMIMEWGRCAREQKAISILMIDVDHFKKYNDTYGHPQGDVLLKAIAAIFTESLYRSSDFASRWGGEEFAVLLPGSDLSNAMFVAERIRTNIERARIQCADGTVTSVTVSIGVNSEIPLITTSIEDFISKSDSALYNAKNAGRNRVEAYRAEATL